MQEIKEGKKARVILSAIKLGNLNQAIANDSNHINTLKLGVLPQLISDNSLLESKHSLLSQELS